MPVKKDYELSWKDITEDKIREILVEKHDFSEERVDKIIDIFAKEKKKKQQKGLGEFF